jgi:hypothetical protein
MYFTKASLRLFKMAPCHFVLVSRLVIFPQGTFTPLVHAHAGRTQGAALGQDKAALVPRYALFCR